MGTELPVTAVGVAAQRSQAGAETVSTCCFNHRKGETAGRSGSRLGGSRGPLCSGSILNPRRLRRHGCPVHTGAVCLCGPAPWALWAAGLNVRKTIEKVLAKNVQRFVKTWVLTLSWKLTLELGWTACESGGLFFTMSLPLVSSWQKGTEGGGEGDGLREGLAQGWHLGLLLHYTGGHSSHGPGGERSLLARCPSQQGTAGFGDRPPACGAIPSPEPSLGPRSAFSSEPLRASLGREQRVRGP